LQNTNPALDGTCASNQFGMTFTSPAAIQNYLPAGGKAGVLDACLIDPSSSHSGNLGGEVLALELNVDFSAAGVTRARVVRSAA
jgi:hypothetical protein